MLQPIMRINGAPADVESLRTLALLNYGHFTSMAVVDRAVRGLDLHLERLQRATIELFGTSLDPAPVRRWMHEALAESHGALTLRVTVFSRAFRRERPLEPVPIDVLVATSPSRAPSAHPLRVRSTCYRREAPHIKHVGTFGLFHQQRLAQLAGFDDALFVDMDGAVSEGSIWNVGFFDGGTVVWPDAPALQGVSMQLLQEGLRGLGVPMAIRPVALSSIGAFRSAFFTNTSQAVVPIASIDGHAFERDADLERRLQDALAIHSWVPV